MKDTLSLVERAEIAAAQAEQHDPRNPGTDVMWQRATAYALLASIPHRLRYQVDREAFLGHPGAPPDAVAALLPDNPMLPPRSFDDSGP